MNCVFSPYQIVSSLPKIEEFVFIDSQKTHQLVVFSKCGSKINIPCSNAVALHRNNSCPICDIFWYECPSELGRKYTLLPTQCGVVITSFEDGLVISENCDATQFGSAYFCFGKIYSDAGEFEISDKSQVTFDFDGNTFTVKGNLGDCSEIVSCANCNTGLNLESFSELPISPTNVSFKTEETNETPTKENLLKTEIIPDERQASWIWNTPENKTKFSEDTVECEQEKTLTKWANGALGGGPDISSCVSHDHPSIAMLPSGHSIIAYENRQPDGITKISIAIISTSVRQNVRYYRKLGKGVLLNNLTDSVATFIVFDEIHIGLTKQGIQFNEKIGFLTGPLAGSIFTVTDITRTVDKSRIKNTFKFLVNQDVAFPDKNDIFDIEWFLLDDLGSADLPSSENVVTILDLPHHKDNGGNNVPVAYPSIAVAQNNIMTSNEQNIYIAYQAFENNEWKVYLREIVLGSNSDIPPKYLPPYLFDENQTPIKIMSSFSENISLFSGKVPSKLTSASQSGLAGTIIFDERFGGGSPDGLNVLGSGWSFLNHLDRINEIRLCPTNINTPSNCSSTGDQTCIGVFGSNDKTLNTTGVFDPCSKSSSVNVVLGSKTIYTRNDLEGRAIDDLGNPYLRTEFEIKFALRLNDVDAGIYPSVWFRIGNNSYDPPIDDPIVFDKRAWRILITRATQNGPSICRDNYFEFDLFNGFDETSSSRVIDGDQPIQTVRVCISNPNDVGDYFRTGWNTWKIITYIKGKHIFFECWLFTANNQLEGVLIATLRAHNEVNYDGTLPDINDTVSLGVYYGFGLQYKDNEGGIVFIDRVTLTGFTETIDDVSTFYEDWFDTNNSRIWANEQLTVSKWRHYAPVKIRDNVSSWPEYLDDVRKAKLGGKSVLNSEFKGNIFQTQFFTPLQRFSTIQLPLGNTIGTQGNVLENFDAFFFRSFAELNRNETAPFSTVLNTSMFIRVSRFTDTITNWPTVWFLLRYDENSIGGDWNNGWKVRVRHYDDPNTSVRKWRISLYEGAVNEITSPYDSIEVDASLSASLSDFISNSTNVSPLPRRDAQFPYLRVDCHEIENNTTQIDVYVTAATSSTVEEAISNNLFKLIHSFQINHSSQPSLQHFGKVYGFAIFNGSSQNEFQEIAGNPHSTIDFSSSSIIDYVSLRSFSSILSSSTGACCRSTGICDDNVAEEDCLLPNVFHSSITCLDIDCTSTFPVGAACRQDGVCIDNITESEAIAQGLGTCTNCEWQVNKVCDVTSVNFRNCPSATVQGSCCVIPDPASGLPSCIDTTMEICQQHWGVTPIPNGMFLPFETCASRQTSCLSLTRFWGRCCIPTGCSMQPADKDGTGNPTNTSSLCTKIGGGIFYRIYDCASQSLPCTTATGACCINGNCSIKTNNDCLILGGSFIGFGTDCSPDPCINPDPIGACCFNNGSCFDIVESSCLYNGTWFYDSLCSDNPCPTPSGACCDPFTGLCENDVTELNCSSSGRSYQGNGTDCSLLSCAKPSGACCISGICFDNKTESECANANGEYKGNFTTCILNICTDLEDPYGVSNVIFKPEDLWTIEVSNEQFITRVLYHMQEEKIFSSPNVTQAGSNKIDFMFVIDHGGSMQSEIIDILLALPTLNNGFKSKGLDVRFGFIGYGRSGQGTPNPRDKLSCLVGNSEGHIFNALQQTSACQLGNADNLKGVNDGFTRNFDYLERSFFCWGAPDGNTIKSPWAAINYALDISKFKWRTDASKFILLATNSGDTSGGNNCGIYSSLKTDAVNKIINDGVRLIPIRAKDFNAIFDDAATDSGWVGNIFDINTDSYESVFNEIINDVDTSIKIEHSTIIERAIPGTSPTFLKKAEVIITYDSDLSDLWTFNKADFEFKDDHVPFPGSVSKGLTNFPFNLTSGKTYGIDPVHIQGISANWVSFGSEGTLVFDYPETGSRASSTTLPILVSTNSTRPKVFVNNRNQVIIAYENYTSGTPQIEIKGTGDFHQNSITGPKASRIHRFLVPEDFAYNHTITLPGDGVNQLCDFIIDNNDITHIVWQSNIDGQWEIYYGNSGNLFTPVRITKAKSRSLSPSINVDKNGSIFVVYHDNRFGPFEIMLASKNEERIIPLIEQDAYLASMANKYTHYTNVLPIILDNPPTETVATGQFWGTKLASDAGNDNENIIYKINETNGITTDGVDLLTNGQSYIAFSSTTLYGINKTGVLSIIGTIGDNNNIIFSTSSIGTINLDIIGFVNPVILDMSVDPFDRLWILIYEESKDNGLSRFRLEQIDNRGISISSTSILDASSATGSLTITFNNRFYLLVDSNGIKLFESEYPLINGSIAKFNFVNIGTSNIIPQTMSHNASNTLFVVTTSNDLYTIDKGDAFATFQTSLTSGSGTEISLPVGTTSGIAFQPISVVNTGETQLFHVRIDFYDNITFEGEAFLSISSKTNLEAFINEKTTDDPYIFGLTANGISLKSGEIGIVFFDSSNFVPGFSRLSHPFSFEPNQTYFPRIFLIDVNNNPRESGIAQLNSFSCTKCSRFGNNNFNSSSCSYSFVTTNDSNEDLYFNYHIDFYADADKQHLIRRFEAVPENDDLQYMEVDNNTATSVWTDKGLKIKSNSSSFIQIYPVLDPIAGFLCGIQYTVIVSQCSSSIDKCSEFLPLTPGRWNSKFVGDPDFAKISTDLDIRNKILGLSMSTLSGDIILCWIDGVKDNNVLKYARYDGKTWDVKTVSEASGIIRNCSISSVENAPAILYTSSPGRDPLSGNFVFNKSNILVFDGNSWSSYSSNSILYGTLADTPRILSVFNNTPIFAFPQNSTSNAKGMQWFSGSMDIFDSGDNICSDEGSCVMNVAIVNDIPSVAYVARNKLIYASFNNNIFGPLQIVNNNTIPIKGIVGLADINGQPAVAYLVENGSLSKLIYQRYTGSKWIDIPTLVSTNNFGKHVAMSSINDRPVIVYTIITGQNTSELWAAVFNGDKFEHDLLESEINVINPVVAIVEFNNRPAITVSSNPFKIYFFKQFSFNPDSDLNPTFFCECSSKIFPNHFTHLNAVNRWESSAQGFADTRVTDSIEDSLFPAIKTRSTGSVIILWEDYNITESCDSPPCIRSATFRKSNQDQLRSSGTRSWFDFDFGIKGGKPVLALDIYNRTNIIYESPILPNDRGFHGSGLSPNELPENELKGKVCDFEINLTIGGKPKSTESITQNMSSMESNIITFDKFISKNIVRIIKVKDEFVEYYTYNAAGKLTPIVSTCNIILEIHGTPEIIAIRIKNENNTSFGNWCAWSPQISDFVMEKRHKISGVSGIKEVCIQAMTYAGITSEFCVPIIADYETVVFETNFYKSTTEVSGFKDYAIPPDQTSGTPGTFTLNLDEKLIELPFSSGLSVANIAPTNGTAELPIQAKVLVEIIPNHSFDDNQILFDVIQQGSNDMSGLIAVKGKNNSGKMVYRGDFVIKIEDNTFNTDGLARISPTFPNTCEEPNKDSVDDHYVRDNFNVLGENTNVEIASVTDKLEMFRQNISGRIGVTVDIRGTEDPYLIFGQPNYTIKKTDGNRLGVPFKTSETEIRTEDLNNEETPTDNIGLGG